MSVLFPSRTTTFFFQITIPIEQRRDQKKTLNYRAITRFSIKNLKNKSSKSAFLVLVSLQLISRLFSFHPTFPSLVREPLLLLVCDEFSSIFLLIQWSRIIVAFLMRVRTEVCECNPDYNEGSIHMLAHKYGFDSTKNFYDSSITVLYKYSVRRMVSVEFNTLFTLSFSPFLWNRIFLKSDNPN